MTPHQLTISTIVSKLLEWFAKNARDLPWRRTRDPYAVWVSEIMLQQTQVKTVIPYWERWMRALPDVQALAGAKSEVIHKLWEGLGYYTRVRNMQKAAQEIVAKPGGKFPSEFEAILELPGIGRYTAGAIASIAFNQPRAILDGNVIRVLTRLFGIAENAREKPVNERLWGLAGELAARAGKVKSPGAELGSVSALNQSLMELGATVCTPRQPDCPRCPVRRLCVAYRMGKVELLPNLGVRAAATSRRFVALVIERRGKFLVRQRPAGVVNAHLWEFPNFEVTGDGADLALRAKEELRLAVKGLKELFAIKHSITRYRITTSVFRAEPEPKGFNHGWTRMDTDSKKQNARVKKSMLLVRDFDGLQWRSIEELNALAFTGAHRKILEAISQMPAAALE